MPCVQCPAAFCSFSAISVVQVRSHAAKQHGSYLVHTCNERGCNYTSSDGRMLRQHENLHRQTTGREGVENPADVKLEEKYADLITDEKPGLALKKEAGLQCAECEFAAPIGEALQVHLEIHNRVRKAKVGGGSDKKATAGKMLLATGSMLSRKKFQQCDLCDFKCSKHEVLASHRHSVHLGVKGNECPTCGLTEKSAIRLHKHMAKAHLGLKQEKTACPYCRRRFHAGFSLVVHIRKMHLDKVDGPSGMLRTACTLCNFWAEDADDLSAHVSVAHVAADTKLETWPTQAKLEF